MQVQLGAWSKPIIWETWVQVPRSGVPTVAIIISYLLDATIKYRLDLKLSSQKMDSEMPGFELGTFRFRTQRSTTQLTCLLMPGNKEVFKTDSVKSLTDLFSEMLQF